MSDDDVTKPPAAPEIRVTQPAAPPVPPVAENPPEPDEPRVTPSNALAMLTDIHQKMGEVHELCTWMRKRFG